MSTDSLSFHSSVPPPLPIHRFTVEQYHRLGELGVLTSEDRVELLEGWIVHKMNQRPGHGFVVRILDKWLQANIPDGWLVQCQLPITLQNSEPEPDLAVVCGSHTDYRQRHPAGADCRLLIEVADTSLTKDRGKSSIYAAAGIEEYWIINLVDNNLQRMTQPEGNAYRNSDVFTRNDSIETQIGKTVIQLSLKPLFADA